MPKTSIIILTYNNLAYNKGVLESIKKYTKPETYEVIMVDNLSTDGTKEWLMKQVDIKVILNDENTGFPRGCNIGIAAAEECNDILLLNNDIEVTNNWLENLQIALYSSQEIGAVQGLDAHHFRGALNEKGEAIDFAAKDTSISHQFAIHNNKSDSRRWKYTNFLTGYCLLIKRKILNQIGLLDERFSPGNFEDDDLSFRILGAGYYLLQCHDCFIHHFGSQSFRKDEETYWSLIGLNEEKFKKKWGVGRLDKFHCQNELLRLVEMDDAKEINVLHIGCGLGRTLFEIKSRYPLAHLYGIETNKDYVAVIKNIIHVSTSPVEEFPLAFEEGFFDLIIMGHEFELSENPHEFLMSIRRYLRPNGHLILQIQNPMHVSVLRNLLNGHWTYGDQTTLNKNNHIFLTAEDIKTVASECDYTDPLIFHWYSVLSEEDEAFIKQLCILTNEDKAFFYRTYLHTVRLKKKFKIEDRINYQLKIACDEKNFKDNELRYFEIADDLYIYHRPSQANKNRTSEIEIDLLGNHYFLNSTTDVKINLLEDFPADATYRSVIIPNYLNTLTKEEAFSWIDKLLPMVKHNLLIGMEEKTTHSLEVSDFKDSDATHYQLKEHRHLFRISIRNENPPQPFPPTKLVHTLLFFLREHALEEDLLRANKCLKSLEKSCYKSVIIFNQGFWSNKQLKDYLTTFELNYVIIGSGENVGTVKGRQACFEWVWENCQDSLFVSELHLDMIFTSNWEEPLIKYLNEYDEPLISCGIVDKTGKINKEVAPTPPHHLDEMDDYLAKLKKDVITQGFTHPCIHNLTVLKEVSGFDTKFFKEKNAFEDDSLLISYHYYYGTKVNWRPKINYNSVVFHEQSGQLDGGSYAMGNFEGLVRQYGAMGLKYLGDLRISEWSGNFFTEQFHALRR